MERAFPLAVMATWSVFTACSPGRHPADAGRAWSYPEDERWTLFHLQAKATHNSYHVQGDADATPWNYTHLPLDRQAEELGVRAFELDVHEMSGAPELQVFHLAIVDNVTTCATFRECLGVLKGWSDAHPAHHPLFIQVEPKSGATTGDLEPFFQKLEGDILAVWGRERLLTPDDVRAGAATLAEAVRTAGWPVLGRLRGKAVFAMDDAGEVRRQYTHGLAHLDGRVMFVDSAPSDPFAAVAVLNDPVPQGPALAAALAAGLLVRTRADSDSVEPLANDRTRLEAALASGAHFISTDYPAPVPDAGINYALEIPGGAPSRCNPVTTADAGGCRAQVLEDPAFMR
ncbi:MAG: hypothetical protein HY904_12480 [Deltaproteobacteria bacterium]|nr:hypothetical protein [Deltaproteobacteria bacterium]